MWLRCGKRGCALCRARWAARVLGVMLAGFGAGGAACWELTLTAPGGDVLPDRAAVDGWNVGHSGRINAFLTRLREAAPGVEFVRVLEVQKRGAWHTHWIVRGGSGVSVRRMRRLAVGAGFGPVLHWRPVRRPEAFGVYLCGYMLKSRDIFPPRTRVFVKSHGWILAESAPPEGGPMPGPPAAAPAWMAGPHHGETWHAWAERIAGQRVAGEGVGGLSVGERCGAIAGAYREWVALGSSGPDRGALGAS